MLSVEPCEFYVFEYFMINRLCPVFRQSLAVIL